MEARSASHENLGVEALEWHGFGASYVLPFRNMLSCALVYPNLNAERSLHFGRQGGIESTVLEAVMHRLQHVTQCIVVPVFFHELPDFPSAMTTTKPTFQFPVQRTTFHVCPCRYICRASCGAFHVLIMPS